MSKPLIREKKCRGCRLVKIANLVNLALSDFSVNCNGDGYEIPVSLCKPCRVIDNRARRQRKKHEQSIKATR
jgi:hypothetical protein